VPPSADQTALLAVAAREAQAERDAATEREAIAGRDAQEQPLGDPHTQRTVAHLPVAPPPQGQTDALLNHASTSFVDLMRDAMDVCDDEPVDHVQQLQALLVIKEQLAKAISSELADALLRAQKLIDSQPAEMHEMLIDQRNDYIAPIHARLEHADADVALTKLSLARLLPPVKVTPMVSDPQPSFSAVPRPAVINLDASNVPPDPRDPIHQALVRLGNFKSIPVFPNTGKVDFDRVNLPTFDKSPVLDLSSHLRGIKRTDFEAKFVEAIFLFMSRFEKFFRNKLTDLFDFLAWRYMSGALIKVDQDQRFDDMMLAILPPISRTWSQVEACIRIIFGLSTMSGDILERVFAFRSLPQEGSEAFARRFKSLLRAAGLVDNSGQPRIPHDILVDVIYRAVPETAQNLIVTHFQDLAAITDFGLLLTFIRRTNGLLTGPHQWAGRWAASQWAPELVAKDSSFTSAPAHAGNKRHRSRSPGTKDRTKFNSRPSEQRAPGVLPEGERWCIHTPCLNLMKRHWDSSCMRHKGKPSSSTPPASSSTSSSSHGPSKPAFNPTYPLRKKAAARGTKRPVTVDNSDGSGSDDHDTIGHEDDYSSVHDITQMKESHAFHYSTVPKCILVAPPPLLIRVSLKNWIFPLVFCKVI
ncbi:hypothetical protein CPC16_002814, partial [Podila verticillata]